MQEIEFREGSLRALFAIIEDQQMAVPIYRGQGDSSWGLVPSLYRLDVSDIYWPTIEKSYDYLECEMIESFFREGLPYLPKLERNFSNDRILAQHFGAPTRFLDWSYDPLVALFFALEKSWGNLDKDAALFILSPNVFTVPSAANSKGGLTGYDSKAFTPPAFDRRIPAQKSVFTLHPYGPEDAPFVPLDRREKPTSKAVKIVINRRSKEVLFRRLLRMGIDRRNLFPGLDGVGADLALRLQCKERGVA